MRASRISLFFMCLMLSLFAGLAGASVAYPNDEKTMTDSNKVLKEMPVLTGFEWESLKPETKLAFILGIGHVVTIEENVIQKHPELRRKGFTGKLAEGLAGVPMDTIIKTIDTFYAKNPDELGLPVMGVIWQLLVKPKLKAGIADQPLTGE